MSKRDYYDVLGVSKDASDSDIKSAYRKLAVKFHPDKQAGKTDSEKKEAEEKFKEASEAYEVLSNKEKRSNYDQFGFDGPNSQFNGFSGGGFSDFMREHAGMFSSFFGGSPFDDFGSQENERKPKPDDPENGRDINLRCQISFKESIFGCVKEFDLNLFEECHDCHGHGTKNGSKADLCQYCHGSGMVQQRIQRGMMIQISTMPCNHCHGSGYTYEKCPTCGGSKRTRIQKHTSINIPAGIESGQRLRLRGAGECGVCGGENGDLYVQIVVEDSDIFDRDNLNILVEKPISPIVASIGGTVEVPSPYGMCSIKINPGTKTGTRMRVNGKGIHGDHGKGDLIVTILVEPLTNLNKEQIDILENLQKTLSIDNLRASRDLKTKFDKFLAS